MLNKFTVLFIFISLIAPFKLTAKDIVLYGTSEQSYQFEQLRNALSYSSSKNYQLESFKGEMPKIRAYRYMNRNKEVDVIFGGANIEREAISSPIRIPILKGLNGWRMPLINKDKKDIFKYINSIKEFKKLIPGQFYSWSDTKILESNHIQVAKGSDYEGLFQMLDRGRIDYFPRSVLEIGNEYEARKHLNIKIEEEILIHYPTAYYFYVAKENKSLAADITTGLERAIADGSFDKIFIKYHGNIINHIRNKKHKVFTLENPFLSKETPLLRKDLWMNLSAKVN